MAPSPDPKAAAVHMDQGTAHFNQNDWVRAIAAYTEGIRLFPCAVACNLRATAFLQCNRIDEGIADCTEAVQLDPDYYPAYLTRAAGYYLKGNLDQAIADNSAVIRLEPREVLAYRNRGREYSEKGEHDLAIADFTQAIRLAPRNADAYSDRGANYSQKEEYDKAIADFTDAIRLSPTLCVAYANRAAAYRAVGDNLNAANDQRMADRLTRLTTKNSWRGILLFWVLVAVGAGGLVVGLIYLGRGQ